MQARAGARHTAGGWAVSVPLHHLQLPWPQPLARLAVLVWPSSCWEFSWQREWPVLGPRRQRRVTGRRMRGLPGSAGPAAAQTMGMSVLARECVRDACMLSFALNARARSHRPFSTMAGSLLRVFCAACHIIQSSEGCLKSRPKATEAPNATKPANCQPESTTHQRTVLIRGRRHAHSRR